MRIHGLFLKYHYFVLCSCEKPQKELLCVVCVFNFMKRLTSLDLKANFVGKRLVPLCANTPKKKKERKSIKTHLYVLIYICTCSYVCRVYPVRCLGVFRPNPAGSLSINCFRSDPSGTQAPFASPLIDLHLKSARIDLGCVLCVCVCVCLGSFRSAS